MIDLRLLLRRADAGFLRLAEAGLSQRFIGLYDCGACFNRLAPYGGHGGWEWKRA